MIIFHSDLDNTLIYSYKRDIGLDKVCVEIYQDREISFMTKSSFDLLKKVNNKYLLVPTTTRTEEQYNRIDLGIGISKYALVCNGGILLVDGKEDEDWYKESLDIVANCNNEIGKAEEILKNEEFRTFEVRNIRGLFLFTKSSEPETTVNNLSRELDTSLVDVFNNGVKVYVVPKPLSKGNAISRFKKFMEKNENTEIISISAGDSEFDISMLKETDFAFAPQGIALESVDKAKSFDEKSVFSDELLKHILNSNCFKEQ